MKKTLIFISLDKNTKEQYSKSLEHFFGEYANIKSYSIKEGIKNVIDGDLALISSHMITGISRKYLQDRVTTIHLNRTFFRDNIQVLKELPNGLKAIFVTNTSSSCLSCISSLYDVGITHLDLYPYYPDCEEVADVKVAITPFKPEYVPDNIEKVIDIGWRAIDISTLMDIKTKLGIKDSTVDNKIMEHSRKIIPISHGLQHSFTSSRIMKNGLSVMLNSITDGVILTDSNYKIIDYNNSISKFFDLDSISVSKLNHITDSLRNDGKELIYGERFFEDELIQAGDSNKQFLLTKKKLQSNSNKYNILYIIKDITEIENLEKKLRKEIIKQGYLAKYTFENIVGKSIAINKAISIAKKIGTIEASTIITGESGTGKELFAQSIHNISSRNSNPFVAINCASIPSYLLESELFGYEEGSFTGAKKGGKKGLFELAHTGTIFLDEIGDMPLDVQAKLLRVLQEKEVMRIGSASIIPIDVMVIAATNQDLRDLIKQGKFRKDLYYRLSILKLNIPALRERKEDIPILINYFLENISKSHKRLDDEATRILADHDWEGNIRELKNCIEHMAYMGGDILGVEDLPIDVSRDINKPDILHETEIFPELTEEEEEQVEFILGVLKHRSCGRRLLHSLANKNGLNVTEHGIRKHMEYLLQRGYIKYEKNKKGATITQKGRVLI